MSIYFATLQASRLQNLTLCNVAMLDFYARKFLRIQPTYKDLIVEARNHHVTPAEINQLFDILSVELPDALHCISN